MGIHDRLVEKGITLSGTLRPPYNIVVPISGGKDSQACLKLALEHYNPWSILALFCDTRLLYKSQRLPEEKCSKLKNGLGKAPLAQCAKYNLAKHLTNSNTSLYSATLLTNYTKEPTMAKEDIGLAELTRTVHNYINENEFAITNVATKAVIKKTLETIRDAVILDDNTVTLAHFGKFSYHPRSAHTGRNPLTGEPIQVPEKFTFTFKASKQYRGVVKD
jgi:nucleoid DNA-binding protein